MSAGGGAAPGGQYFVGVAAKDVAPGDTILWQPMQRGEQSLAEPVIDVRVTQRGDGFVIVTESRTQECGADELVQIEFTDFDF